MIGVDACKAGWVGIELDPRGRYVAAHVAPGIEALVAAVPDARVVGIDIPIGLPDDSEREADRCAKERIGRLRSSVFTTPVRSALAEATHAEAVEVNRALANKGFSIQAWGLREKLLEVDDWVRRGPGVQVAEIHPEVSFAAMNSGPLAHGKRSWAGMNVRRRLLAGHGIELPDDPGAVGHVGVDDVLDAAAVAWTAHRIATGRARSLPEEPQVFSDGIAAAIWF